MKQEMTRKGASIKLNNLLKKYHPKTVIIPNSSKDKQIKWERWSINYDADGKFNYAFHIVNYDPADFSATYNFKESTNELLGFIREDIISIADIYHTIEVDIVNQKIK